MKKSFLRILQIICLFGSLIFSFPAYQASALSAEDLILKIEKRRGAWISLRADLQMEFLSATGQSASCHGKLAYQRLDEKMLLQCFNERSELLFAFKTLDREFELYLPLQKKLFRGNIFSLEDSPDIESQLRPLDLYRALKPAAIPFDAQTEPIPGSGKWLFKIYSSKGRDSFLAREVVASEEGDTVEERYYGPEPGRPSVQIRRLEFDKIEGIPFKEDFFFPRKIRIESDKKISGIETVNETALLFQNLEFPPQLPEEEFQFSIPSGTRTVSLE